MSYRTDKLVIDGHTYTHTHTQATTIPEGQNWPRVKIGYGSVYISFINRYLILKWVAEPRTWPYPWYRGSTPSNGYRATCPITFYLPVLFHLTFTVSLHCPNGRHLPAVRVVQGDCQWICKTVKTPADPVIPCSMHRNTRQSQPLFRATYHERAIRASWCACRTPHWVLLPG